MTTVNERLTIGPFRLTIRHDDALVRDHRVHGVRLVPGAAYLDVIYRAATASGWPAAGVELRNVLFHSPVALAEGFQQRLTVRSEPRADGAAVRISARRVDGAGVEAGDEATTAECVVAWPAAVPPPGDLDVAGAREALATGASRPLDSVYELSERRGVQHRDFMRARGAAVRAAGRFLAELSLGPAALARRDDVLLHPTFLDAAIVLAFADLGLDPGSAYIPMFVGRFRAWGRSGATVYVDAGAGATERPADVLETDVRIYDGAGRPIAEYEKLTVKRVRSEDLILRLTAGVARPAVPAVPAAPPRPSPPREVAPPAGRRAAIASDLVDLVGRVSAVPREEITPDAGFYELGLDSAQLLELARELESRVGQTLYPTLLFEFQTIDALAAHLDAEYGDRYVTPAPHPEPPPAEGGGMTPLFFGFDWRPAPPNGPPAALGDVLLFADEGLRVEPPAGIRVVRVDPRAPEHLERTVGRLVAEGRSFDAALFLWDASALRTGDDRTFLLGVLAPFRAAAAALGLAPGLCPRLLALVPDAGDVARAAAAAIGGLARSARLELPRPAMRAVLLDAAADAFAVAAGEAGLDGPETEVRWAGGRREARRLAELPVPTPGRAFHRGQVVLVSGGMGGIGRLVARRLAARYGARLVLAGRRAPDAGAEAFLRELRALGGEAVYVSADVSTAAGAERAVAAARDRFGPVQVVLHAAGVLRDGLLLGAAPEAAAQVAQPKVAGALHLERAAAGGDLELVVFFSALAAVAGNPGQSDYGAANRFLDGLAEAREDRRRRGELRHRTLSVNWPVWAGGGMGIEPAHAAALGRSGIGLLPDEEGVDLLEAWAAAERAQVAVVWGEPARIRTRPEFAEPAPVEVAPVEAPPAIRPRRSRPPLEIAVVGMSGRYPGAEDLDQLWRNLEAGHDAITEVPPERWGPDAFPRAGGALSRFGGFLTGVDEFDPLFFRVPPSTAALLDPQERLFLQAAYGAVEHAGYRPEDLAPPGNRVGVFVGVTWADYRLLGAEAARRGSPAAVSSLLSSIANRVSYFLDLAGPSLAVDTACSSSLTALHLACRSLADGECDAAIVGGVNLLLHPEKYLLLSQLHMTSSDGRCRSFGSGGDGYVPGEGVGALFLKPLERALAERDTVHGVILGTAINHGGRAAGFTVPHPVAQADAVRRALEESGVDPDSIGYVEAHGTGTALGDPIEVAGLDRAFAGRTRPCALGSIKSNIGHLEAASGIAAISRALLQLRHGRITPSLHSRALNPEIDFAGSAFYVPQEGEAWPRLRGEAGELPRRTGVSAFGAGGSNAHVIIEEHVPAPLPEAAPGPELLVLSARSPERLREYAARIAAHLRAADPGDFGDAVRTLQVGRPAMEARLALVAASAPEAAERLERHVAGEDGAAVTGTAGPGADVAALAGRYRAGDLAGVAALWVRGGNLDWAALNGGPRRRMPLPGYPLERRRYWLEALEPAQPADSPAPGDALAQARRAFETGLQRSPERLEAVHPPLDRYAAGAVLRRLREMGLPAEGVTVEELKRRLRVASGFDRFLAASLDALERHGCIRRDGPLLRPAPGGEDLDRLRSTLLDDFPIAAAYLRLLDTALAAYPAVLRGERAATDVLFPGASMDLLAAIYRDNRVYDYYTALVARMVRDVVRARKSGTVRVLEIGAGTGGASHAVLEALASAGDVEYYYTDIGGGFVAHGREQFGRSYPFARFRVLDMERDPVAQGFAAGSMDVVLAANALHAVSDLDAALARVGQLLAPAGVLVLGEATANHDVLTLTVGLLDGWHAYRDPERRLPHSPLLSVDGWRAALERTGFRDFAAYGPGLTADAAPSQRLMVAALARRVPAVETAAVTAPPPAATVPAGEGLEAAISGIVAACLGVEPAEVRPELAFAEYGVDSILAVKLVEQVNNRFGLELVPTVVFDHSSVRALAAHAAAHVVWAAAPSVEPSPPPTHHAAVPARGQALDIAVIGMSGRFPGAGDLDELWRNLAEGRDSVTEVPPERWSLDEHYHPWPPVPGKTYSRWGGYLRDVDRFDPLFFNLVPAEADFMDPQHRLLLEEAWRALEDAGLDAARLRRARCGVFVGAPGSDYATLIRQRGLFGSHHVFTGNSPAILPARVAYHLDLTGPCVAVDTACSSSLVALHQACESLAAGACDIALAGGVSVFVTPEHHQLASSLGMLSATGRCRTFDDGADGFVIGEGVGVVLLKPLARALADGDQVHGVIKGIGVNQDGRTNGITAPSARSQTELELEVYDRFGIDPESIGYVEAHGTGTRLGDPIEIEALTAAFRRHTERTRFIPIGSIKTNIGHSANAAGIAGLLKILLSLRERRIPPSLHVDTPNRLIPFAQTPFFVNTQLREWAGPGPRRAALSSFGFSGTNCHLVVEEHVDARPPTAARSPRALVPLSARTEDSLRRAARRLERALAARPDLALHDVAATLQTGRTAFEHRLAILAGSLGELRERLAGAADGRGGAGIHIAAIDPDGPPRPAERLAPDADLDRAAAAWAGGANTDFAGLYDGGAVRRISLPGYAFARERCWLPDGAGTGGPAPAAATSGPAPAAAAPAPAAPPAPEGGPPVPVLLAAAAAELGVAVEELDLDAPSTELGFDEVTRARLVERVNRELGLALPIDAFSVTSSLADLASELGGATPPAPGRPDDLARSAEAYLTGVLADEARLPADRIRPRAPLQEYGIDSVLVARLNRRLEEAFGPLPKTLFFEHLTLRDLAGYLAREHAAAVAALTGTAREEPAPPPPAGMVAAAEPRPGRQRAAGGDIAVIGMAGRYPMAGSNDEFWERLVAGRDCIVEIPADRWDHRRHLSDDPDEPGTTYARWGGFIDGVDRFDARFFGIPPKEAEGMDPQQRLFLESAWSALEDAGYTPDRIRASAARRAKKDAGVFAGVTYGEYQMLIDVPIAGYWAVANRVSYHLGFNGPSLAVDTACSASLTAVHLACESLRRGECAFAVAGGVNVSIHPGKFLLLGYGRWASSDGRCRAFGAGGDGYVPGEGVVTLLLKPLDEALEDGDRVYGVIRATAVNHGGHTNGFSVPNPNAQAELVAEALDRAGVDARSVTYVEAHGTGTALGDPIEIAALTRAYRRSTADTAYCVIGSAKANIGHLEAAAGAAGIVKTLLQLRHGTIPPSPHADPPNPNIDFAGSPFRVALAPTPWLRPPDGSPRRAAVSSFGAGGSNAHVVLEELVAPAAAPEPAGPRIVLLSARRRDRLDALIGDLGDLLRSDGGRAMALADVAWTLMAGREAFEHRLALVASSIDELAARLDEAARGGLGEGVFAGEMASRHDDLGKSDADLAYLGALAEGGQQARLAELWARGWTVDWEGLLGPAGGRVVSLPTYPFARDRHWIVPEEYRRREAAAAPPEAAAPAAAAPEPAPEVLAQPAPAEGDLREAVGRDVQLIFADLTKVPADELDVDADFLDFGFDSVVTVRMLNRLMKAYRVRIPPDAVEEHNTIRTFADHVVSAGLITQGRDAAPAAPAAAHGRTGPAVEPVPELAKLRLERPLPADSIFITGVTGVVGGKLLQDLLTGTSARITCLVRGDDLERATSRIRHFLGVYDAEGALDEEFRRRVTPVLGDVSRDKLGLDDRTWDRLAEETDVTIHAASRTTLITFYEVLAPINVEGTRRAVDFALKTRNRYLMYVSSFSALGDHLYANRPPFFEHDLELGQAYDDLPYQETKYRAEKLIRAATEEGLVWNIFRPGNIMGDGRTGRYPFSEVSVKGFYYDVFKTITETGMSMLTPIHWDISPVDYVSAGMVHLGLRHPSYRETYHLTNPDVRRLYDVSNCIQDYGYDVRMLSIDEFHRMASERAFRGRTGDEPYQSQTIEMIKYGIETWGRVHYEESSYADCTYTRERLGPAGINCPTIAELVEGYLGHCIEVGYLPPPGRVPAAAGRPR
jgi:thioester reductase-like protein